MNSLSRLLLIGIISLTMVGTVSAIDCGEDEVAVDKVDGGQECIPEPPSPMDALEEHFQTEFLPELAHKFDSWFK